MQNKGVPYVLVPCQLHVLKSAMQLRDTFVVFQIGQPKANFLQMRTYCVGSFKAFSAKDILYQTRKADK